MLKRLLTAGTVLVIFASVVVSQDAPQTPIHVPLDSVPTLLVKVAPAYPPLARMAHIQGTVVLSALINKEGEVRDAKLVSGHPMLARAAIEAVKQWRYKPYLSGDEVVEVETTVRVNFKLADGPEVSSPRGPEADSAGRVPQLLRVPAGVMEQLLENKVDPQYPADAKEKHIQGIVLLNVDIDSEGNVGRLELVSGEPHLTAAAMDAVLQWRYRPFVLNGEAVPVETTIEVKFALAE